MKSRDQQIERIRERVGEVAPREAWQRATSGALILDIREPEELALGSVPGSRKIVRGYLELRIEDEIEDKDTPLLVICAGGFRSLFAADTLRNLGYARATSIAGGFNAWKREGLPVEAPQSSLPALDLERYSRHLLIPEIGQVGQKKLLDSSVLFVGAGGLGSPAAFYLAAAGVGRLILVDDDVVDRSNLQRQILHSERTLGRPKVESARETLLALNPGIRVDTHRTRLDPSNAQALIASADVVIDGADNFPTRYLVNDTCVRLGKPNVHGSVFRFEGQVSVFWPAKDGPCYRCLYPSPPPPELSPSCAQAGVLGVLPGVVGLLEAVEALKILLGLGDTLVGRLLHYDALQARFHELKVPRLATCPVCVKGEFPDSYPDLSCSS
ncbi:MAG: molybdopterin-synthase adenylyltransferase MoeB [Planctomycetota bacterium]